MIEKSQLDGAINRASKFAVRALKRQDDVAAYNTLKAIVQMYIRKNNCKKALEIIEVARMVFEDF
ncbi:MAG: hypothetical protein ACTSRS_08470 [Candidatus Helarchaeota archaeon]